jgi:hypothetical protein
MNILVKVLVEDEHMDEPSRCLISLDKDTLQSICDRLWKVHADCENDSSLLCSQYSCEFQTYFSYNPYRPENSYSDEICDLIDRLDQGEPFVIMPDTFQPDPEDVISVDYQMLQVQDGYFFFDGYIGDTDIRIFPEHEFTYDDLELLKKQYN